MEDRAAIEAKIKELNGGKKSGPWDEAVDLSLVPALKYNPSTKQLFVTPDNGIAVKIFINTKTGEIRSFWADKFIIKDKGVTDASS